jgi:ABC-type multidrug transport system ATPase subunit
MAEVEACCSRVMMINRGHCIFNESIEELQRRCRQVTQVAVRLISIDCQAFQDALSATGWASFELLHNTLIIDAPDEKRPDIITLAQQHGGLRECIEQRRSLEDVFRDMLAADKVIN